jgi:hypothetical protein
MILEAFGENITTEIELPPKRKYSYAWVLVNEEGLAIAHSKWTPETSSWNNEWRFKSHLCSKVVIYRKDFGGSCSYVVGQFKPADVARLSYAFCVHPHEKTKQPVQVQTGITVHLINNELITFFINGNIVIEKKPIEGVK